MARAGYTAGYTDGEPMSIDLSHIKKIGAWVKVSDMMLGNTRATYKRSVMDERYRQRRAAREVAKARLWDALLVNVHSDAEAAVLHLHKPVFPDGWWYGEGGICEGCDPDLTLSDDSMPADWPCSTLRVMAEAYGLQRLYQDATT